MNNIAKHGIIFILNYYLQSDNRTTTKSNTIICDNKIYNLLPLSKETSKPFLFYPWGQDYPSIDVAVETSYDAKVCRENLVHLKKIEGG